MPEREVTVRKPGEEETVAVAGDHYRFLAVGGETDRCYMIMEAEVPPGRGPPLHTHGREEDREADSKAPPELMVICARNEITIFPGE
jgi:hypothetical protein